MTSGLLSATLKYGIASNCASRLAGKSTGVKGTATIVWNTEKTSTLSLELVGVNRQPDAHDDPRHRHDGRIKGSTSSGTVAYTLKKGSCTATLFTTATFKQPTQIVIQDLRLRLGNYS